MDIICAKCGIHFGSVEAARDHRGKCRAATKDEELHWMPAEKDENDTWVPVKEEAVTNEQLLEIQQLVESFRSKQGDTTTTSPKRSNHTVMNNKWMYSLILVCGLVIIGIGVSLLLNSFMPLWVIAGFSVIFAFVLTSSKTYPVIKSVFAGLYYLTKLVIRTVLIIVSLSATVLGAHGMYAYLFRTDVGLENYDKLFLNWGIPNTYASRVFGEITTRSSESIILPIVLLASGLLTWLAQSSMAKRSSYRRVRFFHTGRVSPFAWLLIVAGIVR